MTDKHKELLKKAESLGITGTEGLSEDEISNAITVYEFVSDRGNQGNAISKARQLKNLCSGWFSAKKMSNMTKPVLNKSGKLGKAEHSPKSIEEQLYTLSLFGLVERRLRPGKATLYKIRMEGAMKAVEAHNRSVQATEAILKATLSTEE